MPGRTKVVDGSGQMSVLDEAPGAGPGREASGSGRVFVSPDRRGLRSDGVSVGELLRKVMGQPGARGGPEAPGDAGAGVRVAAAETGARTVQAPGAGRGWSSRCACAGAQPRPGGGGHGGPPFAPFPADYRPRRAGPGTVGAVAAVGVAGPGIGRLGRVAPETPPGRGEPAKSASRMAL